MASQSRVQIPLCSPCHPAPDPASALLQVGEEAHPRLRCLRAAGRAGGDAPRAWGVGSRLAGTSSLAGSQPVLAGLQGARQTAARHLLGERQSMSFSASGAMECGAAPNLLRVLQPRPRSPRSPRGRPRPGREGAALAPQDAAGTRGLQDGLLGFRHGDPVRTPPTSTVRLPVPHIIALRIKTPRPREVALLPKVTQQDRRRASSQLPLTAPPPGPAHWAEEQV